jgi:hypothetical protein
MTQYDMGQFSQRWVEHFQMTRQIVLQMIKKL